MQASDIMTRRVHSTTPQASVQDVARILARERISGLPVIEESGEKLIGIVTEADILRSIEHPEATVGAVMSRHLVMVAEETPVSEIAALLSERGIKRVPVVHDGRVVGIVSRADIVLAVAQGHLVLRHW